jgi:hypothetical protein
MGFAGGLLGAFAMNVFSRAVTAARQGHEATGAAPGDDRVGRGVQPPQAMGAAEDDATVRVGAVAYRTLSDSSPRQPTRSWLGSVVHYAFGGAVGACYAVLRPRVPIIRAARGTAYGTAVWIVADETIMPLLRLSRGPRQLSPGLHAYALAGHWVYGVTLEWFIRSSVATRASHSQQRRTAS